MEKTALYYYNLCKQLTEAIELLEKKAIEKKTKLNNKKKKMDPVGKEDKDVNNDGKVDSSDEYLMKRRNAIAKNMKSKKKMIKEGTVISDGRLSYGGFPRVLKEEGLVGQYEDNPVTDPSDGKGMDTAKLTDAQEALPASTKIKLLHGWGIPAEFDVSSDEGITQALQHIQGVKTGIDAADSRSNVSETEWAAVRHNDQFKEMLTNLARQRKLKVTHQGIGGSWTMDYGQ